MKFNILWIRWEGPESLVTSKYIEFYIEKFLVLVRFFKNRAAVYKRAVGVQFYFLISIGRIALLPTYTKSGWVILTQNANSESPIKAQYPANSSPKKRRFFF